MQNTYYQASDLSDHHDKGGGIIAFIVNFTLQNPMLYFLFSL
jgi:hypothetical protein